MTSQKTEYHKLSFRSLFLLYLGLWMMSVGVSHKAYAHGVYLFAWVEGDTVYTESSFGGKKGVRGGLIKVFDPSSGALILEGRTDEKGAFSFKIPQRTDLRLVLEATMGHRAEFLLKADEMGGKTGDQVAAPVKIKGPAGSQEAQDTIGAEKIRTLMEEVLENKLKPIQRTLAQIQEEKGPGLTEIIGGVGYIFGIMGLILYLKNRKNS